MKRTRPPVRRKISRSGAREIRRAITPPELVLSAATRLLFFITFRRLAANRREGRERIEGAIRATNRTASRMSRRIWGNEERCSALLRAQKSSSSGSIRRSQPRSRGLLFGRTWPELSHISDALLLLWEGKNALRSHGVIPDVAMVGLHRYRPVQPDGTVTAPGESGDVGEWLKPAVC